MKKTILDDDPYWYKDAVIYELHVKAYLDSANDGIGDFPGLMSKLDYLQGLGITAIWMLPFYPSPLKDDGYDIADYKNVHRLYGNLKDFRKFLHAAHSRGIRVITELVLNHTSDQHPWFQRSRISPAGSAYRDYYVWSDDPNLYKDARIIFPDFENSNWTWDPVAKAYYWHRFYSHQPDLNYASAYVRKEMMKVLDFWLSLGVDGMRIDAIPYLFERDGTSCEGLPETHAFLKELRAHIDKNFSNRLLLAEANQWPEMAVSYFGDQDECQMAFHFPLMPRLFMAIQMEDRFPIVDILEQTPELPESCQWALFLRNHDELTLETVTDEERDYMYRIYATDIRSRINLGIRRRLAPLMANDRRKIELMNVLLLSLPGTPIIYYGDEIGMGDNYYLGDRDGVRTPMQWSADKNAGFSSSNPQRLYLPVIIDPEYHYQTINVDNQNSNTSSLLWWLRRLIMMRRKHPAFGRGSFRLIEADNPKVLAFVREYKGESLLVVINFSRFPQCVELDLQIFAGSFPEELFSSNHFARITQEPYRFTLAPYDHYWIQLQPNRATEIAPRREARIVSIESSWKALTSSHVHELEKALSEYLRVQNVKLVDFLRSTNGDSDSLIVVLNLKPLEKMEFVIVSLEFENRMIQEKDYNIVARLNDSKEGGLLVENTASSSLLDKLLSLCMNRKKIQSLHGEFYGTTLKGILSRNFLKSKPDWEVPRIGRTIHAFVRGQIYLKVYRIFQAGVNPEAEILEFLSERGVSFTPRYLGTCEYASEGDTVSTIALLQNYVEHEHSGWNFTVEALHRFLDRLMTSRIEPPEITSGNRLSFDFDRSFLPGPVMELLWGFFMEMLITIGSRTADLHAALASNLSDSQFAPEPFTMHYQRAIYQNFRNHALACFDTVKRSISKFKSPEQPDLALKILEQHRKIIETYRELTVSPIVAQKIRIHGKYNLHELLFTGKDFVIIDFEGDSSRPFGERRIKRSPLRDAASMIASLQTAAYIVFADRIRQSPQCEEFLNRWMQAWSAVSGSVFLTSYFQNEAVCNLLPQDPDQRHLLLRSFLIETLLEQLSRDLQSGAPDLAMYKNNLESVL